MIVFILSWQCSHLQEPPGRHPVQDIRRAGGVLLPEGRLHHPPGSARWHVFHYLQGSGARYHPAARNAGGKIHPHARQGRFLRRKSVTRVCARANFECSLSVKLFFFFLHFRDDLRTANIICDSPEGVTCLVIDRDTFNQLISNLDEIKNRYNDDAVIQKKK